MSLAATKRLSKALDQLTLTLPSDLPINLLRALLVISQEDMRKGSPVLITEIAHRLGVSQSGASRQVATLAGLKLGKRYGKLDLVTVAEDPADRRRKYCRLTPKGAKVVKAFIKTLTETKE